MSKDPCRVSKVMTYILYTYYKQQWPEHRSLASEFITYKQQWPEHIFSSLMSDCFIHLALHGICIHNCSFSGQKCNLNTISKMDGQYGFSQYSWHDVWDSFKHQHNVRPTRHCCSWWCGPSGRSVVDRTLRFDGTLRLSSPRVRSKPPENSSDIENTANKRKTIFFETLGLFVYFICDSQFYFFFFSFFFLFNRLLTGYVPK